MKKTSVPARLLCGLLIFLVLLTGLLSASRAGEGCTVYLEGDPLLVFQRQMYTVDPGEDLTVTLYLLPGATFAGCDYPDYDFVPGESGPEGLTEATLTLRAVSGPAWVRFEIRSPHRICCTDPMGSAPPVCTEAAESGHRLSAPRWEGQFDRPGWLCVGWNTTPDGLGTHIPFGGRFLRSGGEEETLYAEWMLCTPEDAFSYTLGPDGAWITRCETYTDLVIPPLLDGHPVAGIRSGAFGAVRTEILALPASLHTVEEGAFTSLAAKEVYLFDTLSSFSAASFGDVSVRTLYLNAAREPAGPDPERDAFTEAMDLFAASGEEQKILLFGASSASPDVSLLREAFPARTVIPLLLPDGLNPLPAAEILAALAKEGDTVVHVPGTEDLRAQFLADPRLDAPLFRLLAGDPGLWSLVDLRGYTGLFDALAAYLQGTFVPAAEGSPGQDNAGDLAWDSLERFHARLQSKGCAVVFTLPPDAPETLLLEAQSRLQAPSAFSGTDEQGRTGALIRLLAACAAP